MGSDQSDGSNLAPSFGKKNELSFKLRTLVVEFAFKASDIAVHPRMLLFVLMAVAFGAIFCFSIDLLVNMVAYKPLMDTWSRFWVIGPSLGFLMSYLIFIRRNRLKETSPQEFAGKEMAEPPNLMLVSRYMDLIPPKERSVLISLALMEDLKTRKDAPKHETTGKKDQSRQEKQ